MHQLHDDPIVQRLRLQRFDGFGFGGRFDTHQRRRFSDPFARGAGAPINLEYGDHRSRSSLADAANQYGGPVAHHATIEDVGHCGEKLRREARRREPRSESVKNRVLHEVARRSLSLEARGQRYGYRYQRQLSANLSDTLMITCRL